MAKHGPQEMAEIREGVVDPYKVLKDGYGYGRAFPRGGPNPHDYTRPIETPKSPAPAPHRDEYAATYRPAQNSNVSPAPSEQANQFVSGKVADHNDTREAWCRGMSEQSPISPSTIATALSAATDTTLNTEGDRYVRFRRRYPIRPSAA
jgi:hypothetical protein